MTSWIPRAIVLLTLIAVIPRAVSSQPSGAPEASPASALTAEASRFFLWPSPVNNTSDSSIAVDAAGGVHVAISAYTTNAVGRPAYYAHCATSCASSASWTITPVGDLGLYGDNAALALTSDGRPRMVWYKQTSAWGEGSYQYAECDSGCADSASWTSTATVGAPLWPTTTRYFALDPQGRPRMVISDNPSGQSGVYYLACDSGCTSAAAWSETLIAPGYDWSQLELDLTSDGLPRLAVLLTDASDQMWASYVACDSACTQSESWSVTDVFAVGSSRASLSLALDSQDRPRLAIYSGIYASDDPNNSRLHYAWCNAADCQSGASWARHAVGLPAAYGQDVSLDLDSRGLPSLAYYTDALPAGQSEGLGYAACTAGCETASPSWQSQIIETAGGLNSSDPVALKPGCTISSWVYVGERPSITLAATGARYITFNTSHGQSLGCPVQTDLRLVRFATLEAPRSSVYLPLLRR